MTYLSHVDGLRALAIAAVVGFHAFPALVPGGFVGVDVFFVISGFLITRLIHAEMQEETFSFARFFERRARRLLPAAIACFCVVTVLAALVLLPDAFHYHGRSLLAALFMYANIFFYRTGGYFSAPAQEKTLLHTWSLAVEDQFYLTWPLALFVMSRFFSLRTIVFIAGAVGLASLAYAQVAMLKDSEFAFFVLPTRAWELLLGAGLALVAPSLRLSSSSAEALGLAGLGAVVASCAMLRSDGDFPGLAALPACLGTAAIIASGLSGNTSVSRVFSLSAVVFLGLISYSLYLWHWPLIALASYRLERAPNAIEASAIVAASFAIAILSWRYVEKPFRKPLEKSHSFGLGAIDRRFAAGALVGVLVLAGAALAIKRERGFPARYTAEVRQVLDQMVSGNPYRGSCDNHWNIFANDEECNFGVKRGQGEGYDVAIFGDSMADHWVPLVAAYAGEAKLSGRQVTNGGCALLFGVTIPAKPASKALECSRYQEEAQEFVERNPKLKLAIISGYWEKWLARIETGGDTLIHLDPVQASNVERRSPAFDKVLDQTLEVFTSRGIKVLLIGQVPVFEVLPVRCIVAAVGAGIDANRCGMERKNVMADLAMSSAALARVAARHPNVSVYYPFDNLCGSETCTPVIDRVLIYRNGGHINRYGAEFLRQYVKFPALNR